MGEETPDKGEFVVGDTAKLAYVDQKHSNIDPEKSLATGLNLIQDAWIQNAELQYNLGVIAAEAGDQETAKKYYNKAIALDPNYTDAQNNMAVLILQGEKDIIDQMNNLGSSAADNKRYDELRDERIALYKEAIPYLESTLRINPSNLQAAKTLMNIYSAIDETTKFKEMKAKVEALEAGTGN